MSLGSILKDGAIIERGSGEIYFVIKGEDEK